MIPPGSRYEDAAKEFTICHMYDEYRRPLAVADEQETLRYNYRVESREATYLVTSLPLPPPPPQEYYVKQDESIQFIAYKFLKNPQRWWEIAEANPQIWYPLDLPMGTYISVPT